MIRTTALCRDADPFPSRCRRFPEQNAPGTVLFPLCDHYAEVSILGTSLGVAYPAELVGSGATLGNSVL